MTGRTDELCVANEATSFRVRRVEETSSTNDDVKRAIEAGESAGLVVCAHRQLAGYGRQGRAWASLEGGLYCSLLLRPRVKPVVLPTLSLVAGLAVRQALVSFVSKDIADVIQIKWPNDVVLAPSVCAPSNVSRETFVRNSSPVSKLCGISLEAHAGGVCLGIGVNVTPPAERIEIEGKNCPAYLADVVGDACCGGERDGGARGRASASRDGGARGRASVDADCVLDGVLTEFSSRYEQWQRNGFAPFADEFNRYSSLTGCDVRIVDLEGGELAAGVVVRVDDWGRLVLRTSDDVECFVVSGEAHIASFATGAL